MGGLNSFLKHSRVEGNYIFISCNLLTVGFLCVNIKIHNCMVKILLEAINEATERKKNILVSLKHVGIASLSVLGE